MAQKVMKCGVKRETGYLYFIDKDGDIYIQVKDGARRKEETRGKEACCQENH